MRQHFLSQWSEEQFVAEDDDDEEENDEGDNTDENKDDIYCRLNDENDNNVTDNMMNMAMATTT